MTLRPILTAAQMRDCDDHTIAGGVPSQVLMERAALSVVTYLRENTDRFPAGAVLFLCGSGNNGGDGFAAARFLSHREGGEARATRVVYTGTYVAGVPDTARMSVECARQYELAVEAGIEVLPARDIQAALVGVVAVVDAVFGIGLSRPVAGETAAVLETVAASGLPVLAVDIPSGLNADTGHIMGVALPATATITIQALKAGLVLYPGAELCGRIHVADIGIDIAVTPYARLTDDSLLRAVLPPRRRRTHKGTYGRTALLCGSVGMSGASVLATRAALAGGTGLAHAIVPEENRMILQIAVPEAIVTAYDGSIAAAVPSDDRQVVRVATLRKAIRQAMQTADCLVAGCGLGTSPAATVALRAALHALPTDGSVPVVLDADALRLLAEDESLWETPLLASPAKQVVVTPHPTEMSRLTGLSVAAILADLPGAALELARRRGVVVVLKDAHTVVASPAGESFICTAGNAGMAGGGSGDVLAGLLGALLAQNQGRMGLPQVVAAGVYLHAAAGDNAAAIRGEYGMIASNIIDQIAFITKDLSDSKTYIES